MFKCTMKLILVVLMGIILVGCSSRGYEICSSEDYPVYCVREGRLIILEERIIQGDAALFEKTLELLDHRKYDELQAFWASGDFAYDDLELCQTLMEFCQGDYEDASEHLDNITDFKYDCLVKLLKTDAEYEMELAAGHLSPNFSWEQTEARERAKNRSDLMSQYQDVYDCDSSEANHNMVKARVKQLKYAK